MIDENENIWLRILHGNCTSGARNLLSGVSGMETVLVGEV